MPINPYLKGEFLRHQLADSAATALIGDAPAMAQLARLMPVLPALRTAVAVGGIGEAGRHGPLRRAHGGRPRRS